MTDFHSERVTIRNPGREVIRQFVIHTENKVGWLNDMQSKLNAADMHVIGHLGSGHHGQCPRKDGYQLSRRNLRKTSPARDYPLGTQNRSG
jgi:hypothetical protein